MESNRKDVGGEQQEGRRWRATGEDGGDVRSSEENVPVEQCTSQGESSRKYV